MNKLILVYILFQDENNFINPLLQVGSGSGSVEKIPDPVGQKSTDPTGSGSSSLLEREGDKENGSPFVLFATFVNHDRSAITDKVQGKIIQKKPSQKELSLTR